MRIAKMPVEPDTLMLAIIADRIELFRYGFSNNKKDKPTLLVENIMNGKKAKGVAGFATPAEFEAALAKIRGE